VNVITCSQLPAVKPDAKLLLPPMPVQQMQSNWPLLTVSKGFFESAMTAKGMYDVVRMSSIMYYKN